MKKVNLQRILKMLTFMAVLLALLQPCNWAWANETKNLGRIQNQIQHLKSSLSQDHNKQSALNHQLKNSEITVSNLTLQLQKTQQTLRQQKNLLHSLDRQQSQYQNQLSNQQATLAHQLRAIYMLGKEQYLKVLLNQQNPNQLSRILTYYHYINQHQLQLIQQYSQTLQALAQTRQQIEQHTQQLAKLQHQQQLERTHLEQTQQGRESLLTVLKTRIQTKNEQLKTLLANKQALERVVQQLQRAPHLVTANPIFTKHRGKLAWPTQGKLIERFGVAIQHSQLKSTGVLIQASEGQNVYAVSSGRVVFANWMAGYGLLLIIDHGNGFMTIYGRNHTLYKKPGNYVRAGDLIATVGSTGGHSRPALYFAIRDNGKPLNPQRWCG